jgi:hypothetical protein
MIVCNGSLQHRRNPQVSGPSGGESIFESIVDRATAVLPGPSFFPPDDRLAWKDTDSRIHDMDDTAGKHQMKCDYSQHRLDCSSSYDENGRRFSIEPQADDRTFRKQGEPLSSPHLGQGVLRIPFKRPRLRVIIERERSEERGFHLSIGIN